jgi:hypothetical protein
MKNQKWKMENELTGRAVYHSPKKNALHGGEFRQGMGWIVGEET